MADESRTELRKTDFLIIRSQTNNDIVKMVTPQHFQVGLEGDSEFQRTLIVRGTLHTSDYIAASTFVTASEYISAPKVLAPALSGSLTKLIDGSDYIRGGSNITIETGSLGQITINADTDFGAADLTGLPQYGIEGFTYNGTIAKSIKVAFKETSQGAGGWGIKTDDTTGLEISPAFCNSEATTIVPSADYLFVHTTLGGQADKHIQKLKISTLLEELPATGPTYKIYATDGIKWNSQSYWENTSDNTLKLHLHSVNPGLEVPVDEGVRVKVDGATMGRGASGIFVQKVAGTLTAGTGVSFDVGTTYNGASARTITIDTTTVGALAGNNTWTGTNAFSNAVTTNGTLAIAGGASFSSAATFSSTTNFIGTANFAGTSAFTGNTTFGGTNVFGTSATAGITGSLQEVSSGVPYLVAGNNVTLAYNTPAAGQITVAASFGAGSALSQGSGIGTFSYDGTSTATVGMDATNLSAGGDRTSYFFLSNGGSTIVKNPVSAIIDQVDRTAIMSEGAGIDITFNGNSNPAVISTKLDGTTLAIDGGNIVVKKLPNALSQGVGVKAFSFDGSGVQTVAILDSIVATLTGSQFSGDVGITGSLGVEGTSTLNVSQFKSDVGITGSLSVESGALFKSALTGSLQTLPDGSAFLRAGNDIQITSGSEGWITIASTAGGGTAGGGNSDKSAKYLVLEATASLSQERVFTAGTGIKTTDAGSGGAYTVLVMDSVFAALTGSQFSGNVGVTGSLEVESSAVFRTGLSGSLQMLSDGSTRYLIGTGGVNVSTASSGQLVISASEGRSYTAGTGLNLAADAFSIDDSVVATLTGSVFSGNVIAQSGLSGSLQMLSDGATRYLIGTGAVNISTSSAGQIVVSSSLGRTYAAGTGLKLASDIFSVDNSIVATLTGSQFSGNVGVTGSFEVEGNGLFRTGLSGSLQLLPDGTTPYIIGVGGVKITTGSSGQLTVSASAGSALAVTQAGGSTINNVSTFVLTGSTVTDNSGGSVTISPVIGAAEDSSYSDGLFTDFVYSTPIGTAVDRFNEVLKGLAPSAAPSLDDINCSDSGATAKLSFGSSQSISGYTNAQPSTLTPTDNLSDININGTFNSTTVSNDARVACFAGATVINGTLNADVAADGSNYAADSFGNADQGTLKLFVNDNSTPIHTVDLSTFGTGNSLNGNSSGFNLSAKTPGHFSDGSNFETFQHRQGTYTITAADQRSGWNYARVVHTIGGSDTTCNYVEWVNDPEATALSSDNSAMDSLSMTGTKNLSGAKYNTGGSAQYRIRVLNAYRNVYSTSNITFNGTNVSVSSQSFPAIDTGAGENETKALHLTGSATVTGDPILNGSITVSTNVPHPLKSNLSSVGTQSISGILLYDLSNTSTTTSETFRAENYRVKSGSYAAQADATDASNTWDSTTSLATVDGLLFYNSRLYAPLQGGASGDFRNTADGGSITNGPSSNVNYSGITSGLRTFYRYFKNTSGGSKSNWSLTINGSGTIVDQGTALNSSRIHVLAKLPTTSAAFATGWMDLAVAFATGQTSDGDGCLDGSLDSSLNATNSGTFGTQSVGANEYVVIKIEADGAWTGYISSMSISWS